MKIHSPFPPDRCVELLLAAIDRESLWGASSGRPVVGRVKGFSVFLRKRINYRNSFQTQLKLKLEPEGGGTSISGTFAMHGFTRAFMTAWFGFLLLSAFGIVASKLLGASSKTQGPELILAPLGMVLFGILLVSFGRYLARDEARFLEDFVRGTLIAGKSQT